MAGQRRLVGGAVGGVLEGHPAVAGLGEGAHHPAVQLTRRDGPLGESRGLGRAVGRVEGRPPQVGQLGDVRGGEERPVGVGVDPAHELVGDPVREVEVVGAPGVLPGVVAQLQELLDVGVPGLQVDRGRALAPAALVDGGHRGVERVEERHDAVGVPVGTADQRTPGADAGVGQADAAGVLGEPGDLVVPVVDRLQLVLGGVQQVAGGHLRVPGAGVEEGGGGGQVGEGAHQPVERGDLVESPDRVVLGEAAGDAEHEVLGRLDDLAGVRVAQQVAAVHGAQAEVAEAVVGRRIDQGVEPLGVRGHESGGAVRDQALAVAGGDRLGEGGDALARGLLGDGAGQQAGGEPRVGGVLGDQTGGGLRREGPQLGLVRGGVAAPERGGGDPAGVGVGEIRGEVGEGTQQRAPGALDLLGPHLGRRRIGWRDGHEALPRSARSHAEGSGYDGRPGSGAHGSARVREPIPRGPDDIGTRAGRPGCAVGRSSDSRARRSAPTHRCGTVPDFHRIPLRRQRA